MPPLTNPTATDTIRPYQASDERATCEVWYRSGKAVYDFLPTWQCFAYDHARQVFIDVIVRDCEIWVAVQRDRVVGLLAMRGSYIDRLYIDPYYWRQGWGGRLVDFAKQRSPGGLELHTHVENHAARALYQKHQFHAVKFGTSPPPESAADVEYHWRPDERTETDSPEV